MSTYLDVTDIEYLAKLSVWVRGGLEFAILGKTPSDCDLVWLKPAKSACETSTIVEFDGFVEISTIADWAEHSAPSNMIYEAWLVGVFEKIAALTERLGADDGDRVRAYFFHEHNVSGPCELMDMAHLAIAEAKEELYGSADW